MKVHQFFQKTFNVYGQGSPITPEAGEKRAPFLKAVVGQSEVTLEEVPNLLFWYTLYKTEILSGVQLGFLQSGTLKAWYSHLWNRVDF